MFLITNYANVVQDFTLTQSSGSGATDCSGVYTSNTEIVLTKIKISPNPIKTAAEITLDKTHNKIKIEILNINGQSIRQEETTNSKIITINRNNLKSGVYFVRINADGKFLGVEKLIVE
jgi:hypothetical protein